MHICYRFGYDDEVMVRHDLTEMKMGWVGQCPGFYYSLRYDEIHQVSLSLCYRNRVQAVSTRRAWRAAPSPP